MTTKYKCDFDSTQSIFIEFFFKFWNVVSGSCVRRSNFLRNECLANGRDRPNMDDPKQNVSYGIKLYDVCDYSAIDYTLQTLEFVSVCVDFVAFLISALFITDSTNHIARKRWKLEQFPEVVRPSLFPAMLS